METKIVKELRNEVGELVGLEITERLTREEMKVHFPDYPLP